jgi:hypothetical protein
MNFRKYFGMESGLRTQKRKARTAALKVDKTVLVLGRHSHCRCWGIVVEQNGEEGVQVAIEGGICSFDEYGVDKKYFYDEQKSSYQKDDRGVRYYWVDNTNGDGGIREYDPNNPPPDTTNGPWYIAL